jgi:phosphoglycolate phosphatase
MNRGFKKEEIFPRLPELTASMIRFAESNKHMAGEGLQLLDGVKETLLALQERGDVVTGLVTGNLEPIAWLKMEALGIKDCFSLPHFGGFGSDFCSGDVDASFNDRAEFIRIARARAAERHGLADAAIAEQFHIGDAPTDVEAAELAGASAIGVATGVFSADLLRARCRRAGSSVLPGMASLPATLAALRLRGGGGDGRAAADGGGGAAWPEVEPRAATVTAASRALGLPAPWAWHDVPSLDAAIYAHVPARAAAAAAMLLFPADHLAAFPGTPAAPAAPAPAAAGGLFFQGAGGAGGLPAALVHAVANSPAGAALAPGSALAGLVARAAGLAPAERGALLDAAGDVRRALARFAAAGAGGGQLHGVALVAAGGAILAYDPLRAGPVEVGRAGGPEAFLGDVGDAVERVYVGPDPAGGRDYTLLVLSPSPPAPPRP